MLLNDKVAIITGAGSGIGRAATQRFLQEGARVTIADIDEEAGVNTLRMAKDIGGEATFVPTDVSKSNEVRQMVSHTLDKFGGVHILISTAGLFSRHDGPITSIEEEVFDRILDVNLRGMFLCSKYAFPEILKSGGGSAVLTSSIGATLGSPTTAYGTSKGGVLGLMRSLAMQYTPKGVRVNAILPGPTDTPMMEVVTATRGTSLSRPRGFAARMADPSEPAALMAFLASDESSYITGQALFVDGGQNSS